MSHRTVVTGVSMINALGLRTGEVFDRLYQGVSGARMIQGFDASSLPTRFACEMAEGFDEAYAPLQSSVVGRFGGLSARFGHYTTQMLLDDYPVDWSRVDRRRVGIILGVSFSFEYWDGISSTTLYQMMPSSVPALIAQQYDWRGNHQVVATACASGADAIAKAARLVEAGELDMVFAGGSDRNVIMPTLEGFNAVLALSEWNHAPEKASRPFDKDRNGFVIGDGAGICLIESLEHARSRGAPILCELKGYSSTSEAANIVAPKEGGVGMMDTMRKALRKADMEPSRIDYINAHGTATNQNDRCEALAIKDVFADRYPLVSSSKSMIGHCICAAGGIEAVISVLSLVQGRIPPTINHDEPEEDWADLDFVPKVGREVPIESVLSNSFAFGGHNCSLIFTKTDDL